MVQEIITKTIRYSRDLASGCETQKETKLSKLPDIFYNPSDGVVSKKSIIFLDINSVWATRIVSHGE